MFLAPALSRCLPASARSLSPVPFSLTAVRHALLIAGCLAALSPLHAQSPGTQDTSFTSVLSGDTIFTVTLQSRANVNYVFAAGDVAGDAQLTTTGAYDTGFALDDFGNATGRIVYTAVPELVLNGTAEPKLLLGGLFGRSAAQVAAGESAQNIKRANPDGTLDTTFNPGTGSNNFITAILPLADGGMVVGGEFDTFNGQPHVHIVRLDNFGAVVDNSVFSSSLNVDNTVLSLAAQVNPDPAGPQGQILVAGIFNNVNSQAHHYLARLNADGTVDASFNPDFSDRVTIVVSQPDGKILVGGYFQSVNGTAARHLVRLNYDGSVDTTFNAQVTAQPPLTAPPVAVNTIVPVGDGRYYIGGNFAKVNGVARLYLARVTANGTVDDFDPGQAIINVVQQVAVDPVTNRIYVGETRSHSNNNVFPATLIALYGDPIAAPEVTISASVPTPDAGKKAQFLFTRDLHDIADAVTVYFTIGGTGKFKGFKKTSTGDYVFRTDVDRVPKIGGAKAFTVTFPAYAATTTVEVKPTGTLAGSVTVSLTLQSDQSGTGAYTAGSNAAATVTISR